VMPCWKPALYPPLRGAPRNGGYVAAEVMLPQRV
jgi:hypothetical protein